MRRRPPQLARLLLRIFCDPAYHEEVEGDLDELFDANLENLTPFRARLRYWADVFKHFNWFFLTRRHSHVTPQNTTDMWSSYFRIGIRNILKHKGYSVLNVLGLGVGLAAVMLILLYSLHELSFDKFHTKAERTYVVHTLFPGQSAEIASAPNALVPNMIREFPEVETGVRIFNRGSYRPFTVKYQDKIFKEDRLFHVDSTFFKVFDFEVLSGDADECLTQPRSIVLTTEMAAKYFGDENPMGKLLKIDGRHDYQVTGVVANPPSNSHLHFDFLVSYNSFTNRFFLDERWDNASYTSYLVVNGETPPEQLEGKIPAMTERLNESEFKPAFTLHRLLDVHLNGLGTAFDLEAQNEMKYLYIFGVIGLLILTVASINYTNLATSRAVYRAKEIGMRKVMGAYRLNLFNQFMGESLLVVHIALLFAGLLVLLAMPAFNDLAGRAFIPADLLQPQLLGWVWLMAIVLSFLAGVYPSMVLSGFRPMTVLKGSFKSSKAGVLTRRVLVTGQFVVSIGLIIGTAVIFSQLNYMREKDLGYNNDNMLMLPVSSSILRNYDSFKAEMLKEPGVLDLTLASESPTKINASYSIIMKDIDLEKKVMVAGMRADLDFLEALQMELVAGSFFLQSDIENIASSIPYEERSFAFVLNEAAVAEFDLTPEEALGKRVYMNGRNGFVRGVAKNFHFASMREEIQPMAFLPERDFNNVLVRVSGQQIENTLAKVQDRWRRLAPNVPFAYEFMDTEYNNLYHAEQRLSQLFGVFAGLAIFIACFGLLGLISFTTTQKSREIGVRKVLGASVFKLVIMLNKDFVKLVGLAFIVSAPLTYILMSRWLQEFEYRVSIGIVPIVLSLAVTLFIALMSTSVLSLRAANANPVDVLKED